MLCSKEDYKKGEFTKSQSLFKLENILISPKDHLFIRRN